MDWIKLAYEYVWLIPILPLVAFLIIILDIAAEKLEYRAVFTKKEVLAGIVIASTAIGFIHSVVLFYGSLLYPNVAAIFNEVNFTWIKAGTLTFSFGWLIDNLSIMMLLVVTSVSMLIQIYTHGYMKNDPGYLRFYAYLALFNFSMLWLVLSTNFVQVYIFWELVGLCSYLLIGFWFDRPTATRAAMKAFIVNRIGDCLFLIGIVAFLFFTYRFWIDIDSAFLSFTKLEEAASIAMLNAGPILFAIIAICIFFGPIAKSAQFPLHTWLPDAMEGPTPISALIHAATMVAAGVFLVARAYPIFYKSPIALNFIAWIGVITIFMTATIAVSQFDIKRILAYSTCSQLGYMIFAMGIGAYSAGLFHLCTHAYFKAMLFLCSGAVIHGLNGQQDIRFMGGLKKYMPKTALTYLIGTLAISGILLSGFWSKDLILGKAFENVFNDIDGSINYNAVSLFFFAFISAILTAFYMFRSYFLTFEGEYRGHEHPHESPKVMTTPLIILAVPSAVLGFIFSGYFHMPDFSTYIYYQDYISHHADYFMMILSLIAALTGLVVAMIFYFNKSKEKNYPQKIIQKIPVLYKISYNKWYFDEIYAWTIEKGYMFITCISALFDKYVIDLFVNFVAAATKETGHVMRNIQNGKTQFAVVAMYAGLIVISLVIVLYAML